MPFAGCAQTPLAHASAVHESPSSGHDEPSATFGCVQAPLLQVSLVQRLPSSLQVVPFGRAAWTHFASTQLSAVQALPSSQPASAVHSKPVWKVKDASLPPVMLLAAIAPLPVKRSPSVTEAR